MGPIRPQPTTPSDWQPLPRGRHGLSRAFIATNQHERLIDSMAEMVSVKGYAKLTVSDVTRHAGISRRTFYEQFTDKEACFLAAFDEITDRLLRRTVAAYLALESEPWPRQLGNALQALLHMLASEPAFAWLIVVEVTAAGHAALERRDAVLHRLASFLTPGRDEVPGGTVLPELLERGIIGGVYEMLYQRILAGQTAELEGLGPDILYCLLVPYLGHVRALEERAAAILDAGGVGERLESLDGGDGAVHTLERG